jgi:hypothetical protein
LGFNAPVSKIANTVLDDAISIYDFEEEAVRAADSM